MSTLVLASNNAGKIREIGQILGGFGVVVVPQAEYGVGSVEETGVTFVENALLKARHAASTAGLPAIADDSGIEVDALRGAPGVYSARFAGPEATDEDNNRKLLHDLRGVPEADRTARYQCVIVFLRFPEDPMPLICTGTWEGRILNVPRGTGGFGYDPLFFVPTHGCASAELSAAEKNGISHRAQALEVLKSRFAAACVGG